MTTSGEQDDNDTFQVQRRSEGKVPTGSKSKRRGRTPEVALSSTGGMEDLNRTLSATVETFTSEDMSTLKRKRGPARRAQGGLQENAPRSAGLPNGSGSAQNPIEIGESPPKRSRTSIKHSKQPSEPHMFLDRHQDLYNIPKERRPLVPKPADGNTFTGHKSHDMFRMMHAKNAAQNWAPAQLPPHPSLQKSDSMAPFEIQYPLLAQYLSRPPVPAIQDWSKYQVSPYVQHHQRMGVSLQGETEATLRKKALQFVREHAHPQHLRKIPLDDPDEISASEAELDETQVPKDSASQKNAKHPRKKLKVHKDPPDALTRLIAQSRLLTALLEHYPISSDQKGLREDIALLANAQSQCMAEWLASEAATPNRRRSNNDSAISVGSESPQLLQTAKSTVEQVDQVLSREEEERTERDEQVRSVVRSNAELWQDGSGESVVDVFGCEDGDEEVCEEEEEEEEWEDIDDEEGEDVDDE